jgi:hypothetical protein
MNDAWTRGHEESVRAWNAQLELDQAEQILQEQRAQEEVEAQRLLHEREAEAQRKEIEKKKPKLNPFDPNRSVANWIEARPSQYAIEKINALQYVELDYFTVRGCTEAAAESSRSINQDTLALMQLEGTVALRPIGAQRSSRNIRSDEDLSWEEMFDAKNTMLHLMEKSGNWPAAHAESLAAFYFELELHPRRLLPNGKKTLLLYQSRTRLEWFAALKRGEGFNIKLICEELLRSCADIVNEQVRKEEMEQVRSTL